MSEHDDELASAYLDDAVTAEERARVEGDPTLLERVEAMRLVRDALAAAPVAAPSAAARESAIRTAMGEPTVIDLRARQARRRLRVASIAAAIALAIGAAGLLVRSASDTGSPKTGTAAGSSHASSPAGGASSERSAAGAGAAAAPFAVSSSTAELGTFTDRSALAAAAKTAASTPMSTSAQADRAAPGSTPPQSGCAPPAPEHAVNHVLFGTAVLDGEPVHVDVFTLDDGSQALVVSDLGSCTTVFTQRL